jgi:dTDP-4-amino-4,6-dideoxygalactose transaminase
MSGRELPLIEDVFASNWIAPLGPHVDQFEHELASFVQSPHAVALSSGTAAIHLALQVLGVGRGTQVLCSTLTFVATANPVVYVGAEPVFVDSEPQSWNLDPALVAEELDRLARSNRTPAAVIVVHLYGQPADMDPIMSACERHGVPLIEDAAEALGSAYRDRPAGSIGTLGTFSFNGNKIITTSGGGMLVSRNPEYVERARFLATQARDPAPHYQHSTVGNNYRMSNILAAVGSAQLSVLADRVASRRRNFQRYEQDLGRLPGLTFPGEPHGHSNRWLSTILIEPSLFGATREDVRLALEARNIESRPVWKPLHLQPVFGGCRSLGGTVAEKIFDRGLCLPSGSQMTDDDLSEVVEVVRAVHASA